LTGSVFTVKNGFFQEFGDIGELDGIRMRVGDVKKSI
jgi:hypothetical protein